MYMLPRKICLLRLPLYFKADFALASPIPPPPPTHTFFYVIFPAPTIAHLLTSFSLSLSYVEASKYSLLTRPQPPPPPFSPPTYPQEVKKVWNLREMVGLIGTYGGSPPTRFSESDGTLFF